MANKRDSEVERFVGGEGDRQGELGEGRSGGNSRSREEEETVKREGRES